MHAMQEFGLPIERGLAKALTVMYAEAAHMVSGLMEDVVDNLDLVHLRRVIEDAERNGIGERAP